MDERTFILTLVRSSIKDEETEEDGQYIDIVLKNYTPQEIEKIVNCHTTDIGVYELEARDVKSSKKIFKTKYMVTFSSAGEFIELFDSDKIVKVVFG